MKKSIMLFIVFSTLLISIGGCVLPPPWPDRDELYNQDKDRRDHDHERGRRDNDHDKDRGSRDHDRGHDRDRGDDHDRSHANKS